jgi:hypothetical protein
MLESIERLVREPLFHFLLIGALLFVVFDLRQGDENIAPDRIVIDAEQIEQISARFERTRLRPPTAAELQGLIDEQVRGEIYYREALAMGLDENDPIVRQRMRMKLEFILDDLSNTEPADNELRDYLAKHADRYEIEARVTFRQVFLSGDKREDLDGDAHRILQRLRQGESPETVGDVSLLPSSLTLAGENVIERTYGAKFSRGLTGLNPGDWSGPIYSPFGAHLVKIEEKVESRVPTLDEVRAVVLRDYLAEQRERQKELAYRKLRDGYEVVVESVPESVDTGAVILPAVKAAEN